MVVLAFTVRIRLRAEIYQPLRFGSTALATGRVERRLAAILAADVAGYSRLMGERGGAARAAQDNRNQTGRSEGCWAQGPHCQDLTPTGLSSQGPILSPSVWFVV